MGSFLKESELARNWFFQSDTWSYNNNPDIEWRYKYIDRYTTQGFQKWAIASFISIILGSISARIGLFWGNWMKQVQR